LTGPYICLNLRQITFNSRKTWGKHYNGRKEYQKDSAEESTEVRHRCNFPMDFDSSISLTERAVLWQASFWPHFCAGAHSLILFLRTCWDIRHCNGRGLCWQPLLMKTSVTMICFPLLSDLRTVTLLFFQATIRKARYGMITNSHMAIL
jgi:hypothetical protein